MLSFLSVFPPYRGGIARFSDYLYRNTVSRGIEVDPVNFKRLYPKLLFPGERQKAEYAARGYTDEVMHSWNPLNWKRTAQRIAENDPDALLISYWHPFFIPGFLGVIRHLKKIRPGVKVLCLAHNVSPHERFPFQKKLVSRFFARLDHIILLSGQTVSEYESLNQDTPYTKLFHPVYTQPSPGNSVPELRKKYGFTNEDHILIFFGLVRPYKGLDLFVQALNELPFEEQRIRGLIVGEFYVDKNSIFDLLRPDYRDYVTVVDRFVSDEEAAEFLTLSDLMVLPYRSASQSGILSNAINFNLPVVISNLRGLTEHIEHGKTALFFEPGNYRALKSQIQYFLQNDLKDTFRSNISELKEQLSWERFSNEIVKLIRTF